MSIQMARSSSPVSAPQSGLPSLDQYEVRRQAAQGQQPSPPAPAATSAPTKREQELWSMSHGDLLHEAKHHNYGKAKNETPKSGRITILKWILKKEGITPYTAPRTTTTTTPDTQAGIETTSNTTTAAAAGTPQPPARNRNGAIDHPEAILRTSDPALQLQIAAAKAHYLTWPAEKMVALANERSYQIFKDSAGKMPTRAKPELAHWLAAWDVLKSPREKRWWLGDGIDLVNRAKAMGYDGAGSTKKYDVIVWLRTTAQDAGVWAAECVAEPSAVKKGTAGGGDGVVSTRPAKGSRRPLGWKRGLDEVLNGAESAMSSSPRPTKKKKVTKKKPWMK